MVLMASGKFQLLELKLCWDCLLPRSSRHPQCSLLRFGFEQLELLELFEVLELSGPISHMS